VDDPGLIAPPPIAPVADTSVSEAKILGRYRILQVISITFIALGLILPTAVVALNTDLLSGGVSEIERLIGAALLLVLGGLLLIAGLVMNAVRAVIVRAELPLERYRGPAVFVLLFLAVILASVLSLGASADASALVNGGTLTVGGTLLLLTSTQIGLLAVAGALVVLPRALAGLRLLPAQGILRSAWIGLALAIPAWIVATGLSYLATRSFEAIGVRPETGILDRVLTRGDPTVILLALVVVAPIAEEFFFRGVVYNIWERERDARVALYGSAALFAAIHASIFSFVPIFALGIALALTYRRTRSLAASIALHAGFNAISAVIALLDRLGAFHLPT
jgi:membrane protease YdiL (CAAX protease family)